MDAREDTDTDLELPSHRAAGFVRGEVATTRYPLPGGGIGRFGEWLVRRGVIDRVELFTALDASFRHRCRLGDALVWLELVDRGRLELEASRFERYRARPGSS
jgi:hypothetical protein